MTMGSISVNRNYNYTDIRYDESAHSQQQQGGILPHNNLRLCEDLVQPWNQLAPESIAVPAPTFSQSLLFDPNPLSSFRRGILINPDVQLYHPIVNYPSPQPQQYYQFGSQFYPASVLPIDPFQMDALAILTFKFLALPPHYPPHIESIRADLFSQQMSSYDYPIDMLNNFRQKTISILGGNVREAPEKFSYARVKHHAQTMTQFGVSAPRSQGYAPLPLAAQVRNYRVRQCWGEQRPPIKQEMWNHGQCAENQSLPSVVAQCERLGLESVVIETLAVDKFGNFVGVCENCKSYINQGILPKHPTWSVFDVCTRKVFRVNPRPHAQIQ